MEERKPRIRQAGEIQKFLEQKNEKQLLEENQFLEHANPPEQPQEHIQQINSTTNWADVSELLKLTEVPLNDENNLNLFPQPPNKLQRTKQITI